MRLLICSYYYYYGNTRGIEPQFYYLYKVPESMGFEVDFFDHHTASKIGIEQTRRLFLSLVNGGRYDAVIIATHEDEYDEATLSEAKNKSCVIGWNSDDEWRWDDYSRKRIDWYTFMVTNSKQVYEKNKVLYPNLLFAQWGCTGFWDGRDVKKDINFSFAGWIYGKRREQIRYLKKNAGLKVYGKGSNNYKYSLSFNKKPFNLRSKLKEKIKIAFRDTFLTYMPGTLLSTILGDNDILNFDEINQVWNRSKISFTPLDSSDGTTLQIKSRIFDMGLSGTLMLAQCNPLLEKYYEPDKEYVPFSSLDECVHKVKFYLRHEYERKRIVEAYSKRTMSEHLWEYRIRDILSEVGLL